MSGSQKTQVAILFLFVSILLAIHWYLNQLQAPLARAFKTILNSIISFSFQFVDKQDSKDDLSSSSSVVPSFSIGKKKKEEDIAKRAEEAEEYYKKCVDDANSRQRDVEKTRVKIFVTLTQNHVFVISKWTVLQWKGSS